MTTDMQEKLEKYIKGIKDKLTENNINLDESGTIFYSGYNTLFNNYGVYLIGANPGGSPKEIPEKIWQSLDKFKKREGDYNAYLCDNDWGRSSYQRNIKNAFELIGLKLKYTCGTNLIFQRSRKIKDISDNVKSQYIKVHSYIINNIIRPNVIIAVGKDAYEALKNNWRDDVQEEKIFQIIHHKTNRKIYVLCYIKSKDGTKVLCRLPHFSSPDYNSFKTHLTASHELSSILEGLLTKRESGKLPTWNFADEASAADDRPAQSK